MYGTNGEESASDARASMRPTGSAGGAKDARPDVRTALTRGRSETASDTSRPTEVSGATDQSSTGEVDLVDNWCSVRSDGSQRTRTRPGAYGHECAASDDGSRVSELLDGSRPFVRFSVRSMLGSFADQPPVGAVGAVGVGRAKVDPGREASGMSLATKTRRQALVKIPRSSSSSPPPRRHRRQKVSRSSSSSPPPMRKLLLPAMTTLKEIEEFGEVVV